MSTATDPTTAPVPDSSSSALAPADPASNAGVEPAAPRSGWRHAARWFASELTVVVAGVLIALAVQAWWQGRSDRERETDYLRQLLADTRENRRLLEAQIATDSAAREQSLAMSRLLRSRDPLPPLDSLLSWSRLAGNGNLRLVTGTQTGLLQTGEVRLIRNPDLRRTTLDLAASITRTEVTVDRNRDHLIVYADARDASLIRHATRLAPVGAASPLEHAIDIDWWRRVDFAALRGDVAGRAAFQRAVYVMNNELVALRRLRGPLQEYESALDAELRTAR